MIESLLFEVTPRDPSAALAASAVLIVAGVAASLVPALRAGRVDPSEVLRQD
jgi:ABC-type antimicrobial peptide transport system permease subunit